MAGERAYVEGNKRTRSTYKIWVKKLHPNAIIPTKAYRDDAGWDLYSIEDVFIEPHQIAIVDTGIAVQFPQTYFGKIFDRSGNVSKKGFMVLAGVIDHDYTGPVKVVILNYTDTEIFIKKGSKIAQMVIFKTYYTEMEEVNEFLPSDRQDKGFGSSGD